MKTRILHAAAAAGLMTFALMAPSARADHPWRDSPTVGTIVSDHSVSGLRPNALIPLTNGNLAALDTNGHLVLIAPDNLPGSFVGPSVPADPFAALTRDGADIWGITSGSAPALVQMSITGTPLQRIPLRDASISGSSFVAIAVHDGHAYLADEAKPAIVVADLATGNAQRLLAYDPSLTGRRPLIRAGQPVMGPDSHPVTGGNVRFLALDPNGQWLFYQAACGPMYRINTPLLTDTNYTPVEQLDGIIESRTTPSIGGLTLSDNDTLYFTDIELGSILKYGADHIPLRIVKDARLTEAAAIASSDPTHLATLVTEHGTTHILRIALP